MFGFELFSWADALRKKDFAAIADWFSVRFFLVGGVGILLAGGAAWAHQSFGDGLRVAALSLLFGAACTVSGWLLGLLFGVPRTLARANAVAPPATGSTAPPPGTSSPPAQSSRVNTNLEDISDWLTKTIVGVGLTQLLAMPTFIWTVAGKLNVAGFGWHPYGQMLGVTIFFFFAPGGFWLGYVGTRTILTKLFDAIDSLKPEDVETAGRAENLKFDTSANRIVPASDGLAQADRALLATPWEETTTARQKAAWGAAQARAGNMRAAQDALESANKLDPNDAGIRQQLATLYMVLGRREDAERLTPENAVSEVALFNALYQPEPTGFTKAIEIGEQLASRPGAEKNGNLHTWLACAYGQKYRFVMNQNPNDETLPSIRTAVLREIRAAIAADSNARVLLHSAWKPPVGGPDNDLNGFSQDDPDLKGLLEPS